jgi:phosphoribosylaminoimidazole-succinocarboxamide synthase
MISKEEETLLAEGKTKKVLLRGNFVRIVSKPDLTKYDNPSLTVTVANKAEIANRTTCVVFEIMKHEGIPLAYERQFDAVSFLASWCRMLNLEVVVRLIPAGSFLERHPGMDSSRFEYPIVEVFVKTSGGKVFSKNGEILRQLPCDSVGNQIEDPLVANPRDATWRLQHPKKPESDKSSFLGYIPSGAILPPDVSIDKIRTLALAVARVLDAIMKDIGCSLVDFKIELGKTSDGELVVADVIDLDSCRVRRAGHEMSKQIFRDGGSAEKTMESYTFMLERLEQLLLYRSSR